MASAAAAASAATTVESPSPPPTTTTTNTSTNTNTISTISIKETLEKYLKIFNTHETTEFVKFYAEDINVHFPAFPPINSRTELQAVFSQGLSYFSERIRPTFFIVDGKKSIAMEARMECVALQPVDFKFPFTGKTYKKGEEFTYEIVVHYEFNDDGLIQTWRAFSTVQYPDPGAGIKKEVLPGW